MFRKLLTKSLRKTINQLENENKRLKDRMKELEHNNWILLDTNRDLRADIKDRDANIELLVNNLTPKKKKLLGLED